MGQVNRTLRPPLWLATLVFVPAVLGCVWLGTRLSTVLALSGASATTVWALAILVYCFFASVTPIWLLLQPRGYLGGFVLYLALAAGVVGLLFGGFDLELPAYKGFSAPGATGLLFPFLFVTIACGACSGFHGLVCSGTTSKQIAREPDCRPVGFGAMLLEGFVAVIALATIMIASEGSLAGKGPGTIYGEGLGRFLAVVIGDEHLVFATTFGAMAFSTFVFDTLDVSTRLGRYLLQELFGWRGRAGALLATGITCIVPAGFLLLSGENAYRLFWVLFGTSNQLLAALSLLGITVWLKRSGRRYGFTLVPMLFVLAVTLSALVLLIGDVLRGGAGAAGALNGGVAALLLALALGLLVIGLHRMVAPERDTPAP
jgi:carbon starvation protein